MRGRATAELLESAVVSASIASLQELSGSMSISGTSEQQCPCCVLAFLLACRLYLTLWTFQGIVSSYSGRAERRFNLHCL